MNKAANLGIIGTIFLIIAILYFLAFMSSEAGSEAEDTNMTCCCTSFIIFLVFLGLNVDKDTQDSNLTDRSKRDSGWINTFSISFLSKLDIYDDRVLLRYWTSTISINISHISAMEKPGLLAFSSANLIIVEASGKKHEIGTSQANEIVAEIDRVRARTRQYNVPPQVQQIIQPPVQQNVYQNIIQGDSITKTEVKDSVLNRSNLGGSSKMEELKELNEMKGKGLISEEDYEKMKREIIG